MIKKLKLYFYDILFEYYERKAKYYGNKALNDTKRFWHWENKYWKCIITRQDVLDHILELKGLT